MGNPIMQMLGNMNPLSQMTQLAQMLNGGNPQQFAMNMMQSNPKFKQFYEANKNKTIDQIASENGIDLNMLSQFFGNNR